MYLLPKLHKLDAGCNNAARAVALYRKSCCPVEIIIQCILDKRSSFTSRREIDVARSIYRGMGNMSSSYWTDVHPTRRTVLPPACCSENFVNVISLTGFNAQGIRGTIPDLRLIFRGEPRNEISRYKLNLVLPKWKKRRGNDEWR